MNREIGSQSVGAPLTGADIASGIAAFLARDFMALYDEQFRAVHHAWQSCRNADRPDHQNEIMQGEHRNDLERFYALCGGAL